MNSASTTLSAADARLPNAATTVVRLLEGLRGGVLNLTLPNGDRAQLGAGHNQVSLELRDWSVFERVLGEGDIGFGESYMQGLWETDDLRGLLGLLAANRQQIERAVFGSPWRVLRHRLGHLWRANTRAGSRRNVQAHYDLGNDFYALWLDASMSYSSALFGDDGGRGLEAAQRAKYRRILDRLEVGRGARILEIGCGWGGFAEVAVCEYGCRVHGITLSPAQLAFAQVRATTGGWADAATFELRDYRDLDGRWDHVVSIEMFEAVGERYWRSYFERLRGSLTAGGRAIVQSITIDDAHFARYRRGTDFIQRHVFPGGMLPSPLAFERSAARAGLALREAFSFGADYARTLAAWYGRFLERSDAVRELGFDERFQRMWRFYLAYCEAGFRAGATDVVQFELGRTRT
jgi:cyclopropane-fatty-acyl-phospholipid synthase